MQFYFDFSSIFLSKISQMSKLITNFIYSTGRCAHKDIIVVRNLKVSMKITSKLFRHKICKK